MKFYAKSIIARSCLFLLGVSGFLHQARAGWCNNDASGRDCIVRDDLSKYSEETQNNWFGDLQGPCRSDGKCFLPPQVAGGYYQIVNCLKDNPECAEGSKNTGTSSGGATTTTLTLPNATTPDASCGEIFVTGLTQSEKDEILKKHNDLRAMIATGPESTTGQPRGTNIIKLEWNDELARTAQIFTNLCQPGHDAASDRKTPENNGYVGQNGAQRWNSKKYESPGLKAMIQTWFDEEIAMRTRSDRDAMISSYPKDEDLNAINLVIGHYSQVLWADTVKVGCGYIQYNKVGVDDNGNDWFQEGLICNYFPGGNMEGDSIYNIGTPSGNTGCPASHPTRGTDNLCA